jgi:hypothetical protein
MPVDPGERQVVARLPNEQPRAFRVVIKAGDRTAKIDVSLAQAPLTGAPGPAPHASSPPAGKNDSPVKP